MPSARPWAPAAAERFRRGRRPSCWGRTIIVACPETWGETTMGLNWHDARPIGELLFEKYDTLNPLTVRFTDLHKWVLDLEDFEGKPQESNEKLLEAIQMAWYEEWKDEYGD